ncbi:hypothetical protein GWI33_011575 [Rhynchophorus ferrugineus]|uniref:Uncharacterized protein n=1 Tax=Rhynchophorus ferrugineus TaxID=354439 RepID=A0A834I6T2_RHYFE|nr:hypothetical protein GWI33_011575 [Rhynchophorus ferrugineus]
MVSHLDPDQPSVFRRSTRMFLPSTTTPKIGVERIPSVERVSAEQQGGKRGEGDERQSVSTIDRQRDI